MQIEKMNENFGITLSQDDLDAMASMAIDAMSAAQYRMENSGNGDGYAMSREAYEWYKNCYNTIAAAMGYPTIEQQDA